MRNKKIIKPKISTKKGKPPGSLIYMGPRKDVPITIDYIQYNSEKYSEKRLKKFSESTELQSEDYITWIDIKGLHDLALIEKIGKVANIHSLTLEDLLNVNQRPKVDFYDEYIFIVVQILKFDKETSVIESEQLSIIINEKSVITFLEGNSTIFDTLKSRMEKTVGKVRNGSADYLAYSILDLVIDDYYEVVEKIGERIEEVEEQLIIQAKKLAIRDIYEIKRELIDLKKTVSPIREIITKLEKSDSPFINEKTRLYLRDLYDHAIQIIDTIEQYRDLTSGLADMYLSSVSNKMNEIIKVLTILSSVFIPLTFIVGVYGMNFKNMPELEWHYGYYISLVFMLIISILMLLYFKWRKWL
ncbi:MAG TPA: magnesium/cobalt transporter CorA [Chitinophagales bacterium]|nr:magnesium/cobalt transporter CorA [Chitinophagales bacterium]